MDRERLGIPTLLLLHELVLMIFLTLKNWKWYLGTKIEKYIARKPLTTFVLKIPKYYLPWLGKTILTSVVGDLIDLR